MRAVEVPGNRDLLAFDAGACERRDRLPHRLVRPRDRSRDGRSPSCRMPTRSPPRRLAEGAEVIAGRAATGSRIPAVMARDDGQQPRDILDRCADRAAMIDRIADRHRARRRHQSPGRLQAIDAAPARRRSDRAALVAAERHRHLAGGDQRGAAARRAAGAVLGIVRIADRRRWRRCGSHRRSTDPRTPPCRRWCRRHRGCASRRWRRAPAHSLRAARSRSSWGRRRRRYCP